MDTAAYITFLSGVAQLIGLGAVLIWPERKKVGWTIMGLGAVVAIFGTIIFMQSNLAEKETTTTEYRWFLLPLGMAMGIFAVWAMPRILSCSTAAYRFLYDLVFSGRTHPKITFIFNDGMRSDYNREYKDGKLNGWEEKIYGDNRAETWDYQVGLDSIEFVGNVDVLVSSIYRRKNFQPFKLQPINISSGHAVEIRPGIPVYFLLARWTEGRALRDILFPNRGGGVVEYIPEKDHLSFDPETRAMDRLCRLRIEAWSGPNKVGETWIHITLTENGSLHIAKGADFVSDQF